MKNIVHIGAECFPAAKSGGLGDVLGSLPKYQKKYNEHVHVIIPYFYSDFVPNNKWEIVYENTFLFGMDYFPVKIHKEKNDTLGFHFYMVEIPVMFPREKIYGYADDAERFIFFQNVALHFLQIWKEEIDIIHCHDQHAAFVPFLCKYGMDFWKLRTIPTVFTIHNGEYTGEMGTDKLALFPLFDPAFTGFLEYNGNVSPMISAIKCAYFITTVSEGYLTELQNSSSPLGITMREETGKSKGILNGIDVQNWNPEIDPYLPVHYNAKSVDKGKNSNKEELLKETNLKLEYPLFVYIGRMAKEKGADYLPYAIDLFLIQNNEANFYIIGSGNFDMEQAFEQLLMKYPDRMKLYIGYNEQLARKLYASADFLMMPSRVEPCGLNQMYAMHYGTIPVVRSTGGLKDTVHPIEDGGEGFTFYDATSHELANALTRAFQFFTDKDKKKVQQKIMKLDFSWDHSAEKYQEIYNQIKN